MKSPTVLSPALILIGSLLGGCAPFGNPVPRGRPVQEVYDATPGAADELVLKEERDPGGGPRTRPVIYPPKVFAVYVQEHLDLERDMKIGAHWVFFKLRDSSWMAEEIDREPAGAAPAGDGEIQPLRKALDGSRFSQIVVPYKDRKESHEPK